MTAIALPHLIFLTLAALGAWVVAAIEHRSWDTPTKVGVIIVLGIATGTLIGAWV